MPAGCVLKINSVDAVPKARCLSAALQPLYVRTRRIPVWPQAPNTTRNLRSQEVGSVPGCAVQITAIAMSLIWTELPDHSLAAREARGVQHMHLGLKQDAPVPDPPS